MATLEDLQKQLDEFKIKLAEEKQEQAQTIDALRAELAVAKSEVDQATTLAAASVEAAPIQKAIETLKSRTTSLAEKKLLVETGAGQHALMQLLSNKWSDCANLLSNE